MPDRKLNAGLRALLAIVGGSALIAGVLVTATELRWISRGSAPLPAALITGFALLVAASGAYIIRGAIRGRIVVRRTGISRER